jgi:hypothetical protein
MDVVQLSWPHPPIHLPLLSASCSCDGIASPCSDAPTSPHDGVVGSRNNGSVGRGGEPQLVRNDSPSPGESQQIQLAPVPHPCLLLSQFLGGNGAVRRVLSLQRSRSALTWPALVAAMDGRAEAVVPELSAGRGEPKRRRWSFRHGSPRCFHPCTRKKKKSCGGVRDRGGEARCDGLGGERVNDITVINILVSI